MLLARLGTWFHDKFTFDPPIKARYWASGWLADLTGPLLELLPRTFAMFFTGAAILPVVPGGPVDPLFESVMVVGALLSMAVLVSRIVRTAYVDGAYRAMLKISAISVPFFVADLAWLTFGVLWLRKGLASTDLDDPIFTVGNAAIVLSVNGVLLGLRIWSRMRAWAEYR